MSASWAPRGAAGGRRQSRRERRDLVAERLALPDGENWRRRSASDVPALVRLARALPELGPVFCAFGRYLATRLDLLSETDCQVLAAVPDRRPALPVAAVRELLLREWGRSPEGLFAAFEPQPAASGVLFQDHRGRLAGGDRVVVRLVRPELEAELSTDLELLPLLGPPLAGGSRAPGWLGAAVEQFSAELTAAVDLAREADDLSALGKEGKGAGFTLAAPRVLRELCSRRVIVVEDLPGSTLEELAGGGEAPERRWPPEPQARPSQEGAGSRELSELAARMCQTWLRQACFGQSFPVDFSGSDVRQLAGRRLAWTGGSFGALTAASKINLWDYLLAAADNDPERAGTALSRELDGGPGAGGEPLGRQLRQLVPFRDGGWGARDDLAGYLFLHWRCATQAGYLPRPDLIPFYRGLARVAFESRRLAPGCDALRESLERLRLTSGLGDLASLFNGEQVKELAAGYAAALLALPQRVDELMTLIAEGRTNLKVEVIEPPGERRRKDASAAYLAMLLAVAALVLLASRLVSAGGGGSWVERTAAVLLALLGALLLKGARRGRR